MVEFRPVDLAVKTAYYLQIAEEIKQKIDAGELQAGDPLPSEAALCEMFQVSRTAVRQALTELERDGMIYKRRGKGSFISDYKININLTQVKPQFMSYTGKNHDLINARVIDKKVVKASRQIANYMKIVSAGDQVLMVERLRLVNNIPALIRVTYLPYPAAKSLLDADLTRSLFALLSTACNVSFDHGQSVFEAIQAPEREAKILEIEPGSPMLVAHSNNFNSDETFSEYSCYYMRGDRSRVTAGYVYYDKLSAQVVNQPQA